MSESIGNARLVHECIVIGVSAGGFRALSAILPKLPGDAAVAVLIVQHTRADAGDFLVRHLDRICQAHVKHAEDKEPIVSPNVYIAPPGYHLLVERNRTLSLTLGEPEHFARPSINVLFESAAHVYQNKLIGIILTGAGTDGSLGIKRVKENGGLTIVQDPKTADVHFMPRSAIQAAPVDYILPLDAIGGFLSKMGS